ncbi:MAG TPA: PAS domain-containing protein, partial [Hyphomicrobiaceae bacterium]|nr:PAS domain-containing protein [Hyphomicrobiaceae bacterium]
MAGNISHDRVDLSSPSADWLASGGEMARLVRAQDWASTPLGPFASWPQSLRSALSICLGSRFPIVIYWGPDLVVLYNDAYAEILGQKHPWALGRPCREVWSEIWDVIRPMLDRVLTRGDATWSEDQLLLLERRGYPEECYFSFSFSPVHGANGGVDGIFTAVIENTGRVLGERRLRTLRDLGSSLTAAKSAEEACRVAANVLADNCADVPFALLYLVDPQSRRGRLVASTGGDSGMPAAPTSFELDDTEGASAWPLTSVCRSGEPADVGTLSSPALLLPMATAGEPLCTGVIAVGVSPRRELDQEYKGFFELIARRVAAAIAEARAYEAESRR